MNVVLISTSDVSQGRSDSLNRLLHAVERVATRRPDFSIVLLLLLQKCPDELFRSVSEPFPSFVESTATGRQISLSAARNTLLIRASSIGLIDDATVVGFPDDDCWYPEDTLEYIVDAFGHNPQLDLWFCRYASRPHTPAESGVAPAVARARDVIRQASSNTMFLSGAVLKSSGSFDEALGVGTFNGGGEDTEFALRAYLRGRQSVYFPSEIIGHRDNTPHLRRKYYRGALIAIARHAKREPWVGVELVRKLLVGIWLVVSGQLSLASYTEAVRAAVQSNRVAFS